MRGDWLVESPNRRPTQVARDSNRWLQPPEGVRPSASRAPDVERTQTQRTKGRAYSWSCPLPPATAISVFPLACPAAM